MATRVETLSTIEHIVVRVFDAADDIGVEGSVSGETRIDELCLCSLRFHELIGEALRSCEEARCLPPEHITLSCEELLSTHTVGDIARVIEEKADRIRKMQKEDC